VPFLLYPLTAAIQLVAVFIGLTIYGAMWSAAQDRDENGWLIALLWTIALVTAINGYHFAGNALSGLPRSDHLSQQATFKRQQVIGLPNGFSAAFAL
jgi:hypothetical protein